ncbi:NAD-dependent nucleoside diphosphate-sugar epimerase/dehydratase [Alicyclobacillus contaminans]|uniref:NAD-dependent epimerase/dehydratase family protein n=1 Tax=Alicyclobacillus contaminans TaxID=392016 RepID=UPI000407B2C5|nr:NAD-dependent epimerase/dehydratase family protein [Alicyclobacillus contaminans]GMA51266.1 NAD-dependent nucleoside diphosphate-sugar epimerase/dehydratase [Alicyclobacillus contaminans]
MNVFVTGGTGYIGQPLVRALIRRGHHVVAWQRTGSPRPLAIPGVRVVEGDLFNVSALTQGMRDCEAVVHLVGILREMPRKGATMQRIHVDATEAVLTAAAASGITAFSHMSALGARPTAVSTYHRSKWAAEELVRQSGIPYTIFRPSVVFGNGGPGPNFVNQLAQLIRTFPWVPVIGDGRYMLQPVAMDTVVDAFLQSVQTPRLRTYDLGGLEVLSYLDILHRIADHLGKRLRTMTVPTRLMTALIPMLQHIPGFPLTEDQLIMLLEGNICADATAVYRDFRLEARPFRVE